MFSLFKRHHEINTKDVKKARRYIDKYWADITIDQKKDEDSLIGLPHPYLVPAVQKGNEFEFREMYYWDSYFMVQGMLDEKHKNLVLGLLDDIVYLYKKYGIVPNASRTYMLGRSQPPLMTSFIWDVYEAYDMGEKWLGKQLAVAMAEYKKVWMGQKKPHERQVYKGLSRYYDINVLHDLAETESGWDMTPRFNRRCLNYLPVDLNAFLYIYEVHFARYYHLVRNATQAAQWEAAARKRKKTMDSLMWSRTKGMYYDYNFVKKKRGSVSSLAGLVPLWAGMVDADQAGKLVKAMRKFEQKGGLAATDVQQLNIKLPGAMPTQWAYPNGWAPLHFMVIKGLEKYGYKEDAKRIAYKWLRTNLDWFDKSGYFIEKYNVVDPSKPPAKGVYPTPAGFGWSNSVFEYLCQKYVDQQN